MHNSISVSPLPKPSEVEDAPPSITIDMARSSLNGVIRLEMTNLDASLSVDVNGTSLPIALGDQVRSALNGILPVFATVSPSITLGLPQCIDMHNVRFEAATPCRDYGNLKVRYVSKETGPAPVTYSVDFRKTSVSAINGEIDMGFQR
jgi:hypothetical protein